MELVVPSERYLAGYVDALERGFSPDTTRPEAAGETLAAIERDAAAYLRTLDDRHPVAQFVVQRDGTPKPKLPGFIRWMWDGEFAGYIGIRWQPGTNEMPDYVPGHIGYAVVPWKQRRGYATKALAMMLDLAAAEGLDWVDLTTDHDNAASQAVIATNGGVLVEEVGADAACDGHRTRRFRIDLVTSPRDLT
jgi:predicted acetyltransferase